MTEVYEKALRPLRPRAIPRITVRIDRGEDWVEMSGDWEERPTEGTICGQGDTEDWCDLDWVRKAWLNLHYAVIE